MITISKRGGFRRPKKLKDGQSLLLKALWEKHGGVFKVARLLHEKPQILINWKARGRVPLEKAGNVARLLSEDPYAFNFIQYALLFGEVKKSWKEVVKDCKLSKITEREILNATEPVSPSF